MELGCEWRHARKREFGDFEKDVSWDLTLGKASPSGGYEMRGVFVRSVSWDLILVRASPAGGWLWAM